MGIAVTLLLAFLLSAGSIEAEDALARGERLLERREYVAAEAALREATAADPSSARAHGNLALALLSQGRLPEAVDLRLDAQQQRFVDAARELTRARDAGATDVGTLSLLCSARWQAGDIEATLEAFAAALKSHPEAAFLHEDFGRFLLAIGRPERARANLEEAVRLRPGQASAHLELGRAYEAVGKVAEAEQAYRKTMSLAPELAAPHYALGSLLTRHGDREQGQRELVLYRTFYERAARVVEQSRVRDAEIALAWAELRQGDAGAALARFESFPASAETLIGQASALSRLQRHHDAVRVLERARELEPGNDRIRALLGSARTRSEEKR